MSSKPSSSAAKSKGKPTKKVVDTSSSDDSNSDSDSTKKSVPKSKPPPKKKKAVSSSESESESDSDVTSSSDDDTPVKKKAPAKKVAAKKKAVSSSDESSESSSEDSDRPVKKKPAAKKPAPKKKVQSSSESESESESDSDDSESDSKPASKSAAGKKGVPAKKGKETKKAADEDLDAILADIGAPAAAAKPAAKPAEGALPLKEDGTVDESKLSKAQLKRLRQKQREADVKAGKIPSSDAATEEKSKAAATEDKTKDDKKDKGKDDKKSSKAAAALKERLAKQKEEAERLKREEEERKQRELDEIKRQEEAAKKAEEERLAKIEERKKKKEELRKAGKLLTPAQKAQQEKNRLFIEQLKASGQPIPQALLDKMNGVESSSAPTPTEKSSHEKRDHKGKGKGKMQRETAAQIEARKIREAEAAAKAAEKAASDEIAEITVSLNDIKLSAEEEKQFEPSPVQSETEEEDEIVSEEELSADEQEEVLDSWEDADSDAEKRKADEKEARRQVRMEEKRRKANAAREARKKEIKQKQLAQKKTAMESKRQAYLEKKVEELKKKLQTEAIDKKKAEQAKEKAKAEGKTETTQAVEAVDDKTKNRYKGELRSPICCILGHVDTGKTKILDKIRQTNVQAGEAGGITQQIGATYMPLEVLKQKLAELEGTLKKSIDYKVPGLLVIDTPGHESFTNLRSRGSGLCDIAILVVDIMAGLEQQTIESINLLKMRKTPFVVALNKIDRCYGWQTTPNAPVLTTLAKQRQDTLDEFEKRTQDAINLLAGQGLNCCLYYKNKNFAEYVSVVPTSAVTGEGIPDLLMLLIQLTQNMMNDRLTLHTELQCTVLEVKVIEGLGTTIDVILVNGVLHEGDTIVVCGMQGPIVTSIRALLTPPPMAEMRIKADYVHHKVVKAAMGVKISAQGLEHAVAGSQLLVWNKRDDLDDLKDTVQQDLASILSKVDRSGKGVYVQASTLGSLEALLQFLSDMKIPVSGIQIGPVHKKDVIKCAVMLEHKPEYAVILAFDVKVVPEAHEIADKLGVKIFTADIIYHLFDQCTAYMEHVKNSKRVASAETAVFPVVMDIIPTAIFNVKQPIVIGCRIVEGIAKIGTPLCVPAKDKLMIGRITGLEKNHTEMKEAKKGDEVAVKIEQQKGEAPIIVNRHFDATHQIVSKLTRESIDLLKANFKDDLTPEDWRTVIKLKKVFDIL